MPEMVDAAPACGKSQLQWISCLHAGKTNYPILTPSFSAARRQIELPVFDALPVSKF
jgi:hypothetical protein